MNQNNVDRGWIAFEPKLAKAVEAQDAGFDPENVTVRIRPSRRFRNCIRNVVYRTEFGSKSRGLPQRLASRKNFGEPPNQCGKLTG